jgi:hypothetical protein
MDIQQSFSSFRQSVMPRREGSKMDRAGKVGRTKAIAGRACK